MVATFIVCCVPSAGIRAVVAQSATPVPQVPRDHWKDCAFNDRVIRCIDTQLPDGGMRIVWIDGPRMTYRRQPEVRPGDPPYMIDTMGGVWRLELLAQGNILLTNLANSNRIFVPLRLTCKPPLKGEVGYCHP
jgi:hypothetical protein